LGNQFLSHIRETAAICHVLRSFSDPDIIREGAVSPAEDLAIIRFELQLADLATIEKQKQPKGALSSEEKERWRIVEDLKLIIASASGKRVATDRVMTEAYQQVAQELNLLSTKPELVVLNVAEDELRSGEQLKLQFGPLLDVQPAHIVVISARIESELAVLSSDDQTAYLHDLGLEKSGLERLAEVAYRTLGLQSFLTAGELEVRAWTIPQGAVAPEAAGVIHTDFIKHFIKANIASYSDFVACGGWKGVREAGKLRQEGKDYIMQEGDVVEFMIGK
jgi:GTP-binding protein YchF